MFEAASYLTISCYSLKRHTDRWELLCRTSSFQRPQRNAPKLQQAAFGAEVNVNGFIPSKLRLLALYGGILIVL